MGIGRERASILLAYYNGYVGIVYAPSLTCETLADNSTCKTTLLTLPKKNSLSEWLVKPLRTKKSPCIHAGRHRHLQKLIGQPSRDFSIYLDSLISDLF
jgi:hypothetical protein